MKNPGQWECSTEPNKTTLQMGIRGQMLGLLVPCSLQPVRHLLQECQYSKLRIMYGPVLAWYTGGPLVHPLLCSVN